MKIRERRAQTRLHSSLLIFMNRNGSNGGLVFNITETGMALSSAQPLFEDRFINLRVQSSDSFEWIDLTGQIVWKSKSKKEIGIQFVGLENEALQRIRSWIALETSSRESHSEANTSVISPPETLPRMKSWIFSEASRVETSWQETGPPGSVRNEPRDVRNWLFSEAFQGGSPRQEIASPLDSFCTEPQDVRNWLFPEASFSKPSLDSKRPIEEQAAFHTETKNTPRPSNTPRTSLDAVTEKQLSPSSTSTDSDAPLNCAEREGAQRASPETQQVSTKRKRPPAETRPSVGDRRCFQRTRIVPFGYLQMDGSNGGIVLNISESGVAITTATILTDDRLPFLNIQFPDVSGWIEASGQIAWKSESKKEAGVRFVGLTEEARQRISDWISAQATTDDLQEQEQRPGTPEKQEEKLELTDVPERGIFVPVLPAPAQEATKLEEAPLLSSASASSSQSVETRTPAPETFAPSRKPHRKPIRFRPRWAHIQREASGWRSAGRALAALFILAVSSLITWEWILPQSDVHTDLTAAVTLTTKAEAGKKPVTSAEITTRRPPTAQVEPKNPQPPQTEPVPARNKNESLGDRSLENPRKRLLAAPASAKPIPKAASRPAENLLVPEEAKRQSWHVAASVNTRPLKNVSETAGSVPPAPPQLHAELIQPANPAPLTTNTSQPAAPKAKESPILPATQPATPANYAGTVAILADPYPALRLPDGRKSKNQHQVASLQLGHLLSRVEPVYPEEAKQQGIQGTVRLHAIIDRHGNVGKVESVNGPTALVAAAMNAVRHWRYTETLLAGQSVETEEDIAVIFRLSNSETPKK